MVYKAHTHTHTPICSQHFCFVLPGRSFLFTSRKYLSRRPLIWVPAAVLTLGNLLLVSHVKYVLLENYMWSISQSTLGVHKRTMKYMWKYKRHLEITDRKKQKVCKTSKLCERKNETNNRLHHTNITSSVHLSFRHESLAHTCNCSKHITPWHFRIAHCSDHRIFLIIKPNNIILTR